MEYRLEELLDILLIQDLQDKLNNLYSFPSAIVDNDGKVLTAVAWQDICTKFHRINPICEKECIKSDKYILEHLQEANPAVSYLCPHGLLDNAIPIIIDGKHLGNFFTGQFFLEKPDLNFFVRQAQKYGFNQEEYLEAVKKVPIWTRETLAKYLEFIKGFIEIIAGIGLKQLKEIEANRVIREGEQKYRMFIDLAPDAFFHGDVEGNFIEVNFAAEELTGYSREELLEMNIKDLFSPVLLDNKPLLYDLLQYGETIKTEREIIMKDRSSIFVEMNSKSLPDGTYQSLFRDITKRITIEQELIKAKDKAEESDRLKSAFLANMSHEIRTPMNGIMGFAQLLKEPELSRENQKMYTSIIEKSGARMLNIIDEIMDMSKIESGQMSLNYQETNINELLESIYYFFKPEAINKGIGMNIKNRWHAGEANIKTDKEKLYAILSNLVKNAIKYTEKGKIEFGVKLRSSVMEFFVEDTGIGIPNDRQDAIFERFVQSDISDIKARQGAGLGLSISKSYVEMLGGKIWVESKYGQGSTFYFTLPFLGTFEEKEEKENVKLTDYYEPIIKNLKILIAEDDESSAELLTIFLKNYSREILVVSSGKETVQSCRENPDIDLVFMDIQMPEMDGYEATREIRQFNNKVVIIAQTAFALSGDRGNALQAGCNDYISKPIDSNLLKKLMVKNFNKIKYEKGD